MLNLVLISSKRAALFPTAEAVDDALRDLAQVPSALREQRRVQVDTPRSLVVLRRRPGAGLLGARHPRHVSSKANGIFRSPCGGECDSGTDRMLRITGHALTRSAARGSILPLTGGVRP
jgi:hypothetical protein